MASVVTPEAVLVEIDTAGLGSRLVAAAIDALIMFAAFMALLLVGGGVGALTSGGGGGELLVGALVIFSAFALRLLYPALLESRWRGRTLGKAAMGLRVVTTQGAPIRFRHAIIRAAVGFFEIDLTGGGLALIAVLVSRRNQRLGDYAAGTMVVRERTAARATEAVTFLPVPGTEDYAATLDVAGLGPAEYGTVRSFLLRAPSLAPDVRDRLARQIATPLAARMRHLPPGSLSAEVFLVAVAAAVQRRGQQPPEPVAPAVVAPDPPASGGFAAPT